MKQAPTLCDGTIREWSRPAYKRTGDPGVLVRALAGARKFVLDESMSAYMGDLGNASMIGQTAEKTQRTLESLRVSAMLPHPVTWIEFDLKARNQRSRSEYEVAVVGRAADLGKPMDEPDRHGWLCCQHPQLETAFFALPISSHSVNNTTGVNEPKPIPNMFSVAWRTDDGPPPWPKFPTPETFEIGGKTMPIEGLMTGVWSYRNPNVCVIPAPHLSYKFLTNYLKHTPFNVFAEIASDLRYLWALLATINDLPVSIQTVQPDRGYISRGQHRKFVEHKIIHLTVPQERWRTTAKKAIAITRRKAHMVRAFWRKDWRNPLSPLCEHEFVATDANHTACTICKGIRIKIPEHQRGDAGLGFVLHDYTVEHEERP